MPCYTVQCCSCNLEKADIDLLEKALKKLGYSTSKGAGKTFTFSKNGISGSYSNNKLNFRYSSSQEAPDTDAIKRAYSEQVIKDKAKAYQAEGWEFEQDGENYTLRHPSAGYGAVYA